MTRGRRFALVALLLASIGFGAAGCASTLKLFEPDESGQSDVTRAGQTISDIGAATGNPWLLLAGQVVTFAGAVWVAVRKAKAEDDSPLSAKQRGEVVAAVKAEGIVPGKGA